MYGSPIRTLRAGLRATLGEEPRRGRLTSERHIPRGKRTRWPSMSAPAPRKISTASGKLTISMPTCSSRVSALASICSRPSVEMTSTGGSLRVRYGSVSIAARQALRLAGGTTAPHRGVFEVRERSFASPRVPGRVAGSCRVHGTARAAPIRAGGRAPGPRRRRGWRGGARPRRRSGGTARRARSGRSASAVSETGVSAMTSASASSVETSPVSVDRTVATPSRHPRTQAEVIDRPPASAKRFRSGPSAALW